MSENVLGQVFALAAAVSWSIGLILFKKSGATIGPIALNLFKNTVAIVLLTATLIALPEGLSNDAAATATAPSSQFSDAFAAFTPYDFGILALSGVIGIAIADTIFFIGLRRIGVGLISIFDCLYSPAVVFFAFVLHAERLSAAQWIGGAFILSAILLTVGRSKGEPLKRNDLLVGMACSATAVTLMALGIVLAKPVIEERELLWSTLLRLIPGTLLLYLVAGLLPHRKTIFSVFRPTAAWRFMVPGSIVGAYFCLIFWIAGFKYVEQSGVAAFLNQTSVVFSIVLAAIFLREALSARKVSAVILALIGVGVMQFG